MATQMQTQKNQSEPLPVWLSIPVILICLCGGGFIIHWYVMTDPVSHEAKILGAPPTQAIELNRGGGGGVRMGTPGGGRNRVASVRNNRGNWTVHTELANADLTVNEVTGKVVFRSANYNRPFDVVPAEAMDKVFKARPIVTDKDPARLNSLKLPPDKVKTLRSLVGPINMELSPADKAILVSELEPMLKIPDGQRADLDAKIERSLDEIAARSAAGTKQDMINRANQIDAIITPELWQQDADRLNK